MCRCVPKKEIRAMQQKWHCEPQRCSTWDQVWNSLSCRCESAKALADVCSCSTGQTISRERSDCQCVSSLESRKEKKNWEAKKVCTQKPDCSQEGYRWDESKCVCRKRQSSDCQMHQTYSSIAKKCIDLCPGSSWSEKKKSCVDKGSMCPLFDERWSKSAGKCMKKKSKCPKTTERWSHFKKTCVRYCPGKDKIWSKKQGKCVNEPCPAANERWSPLIKRCIASKCPKYNEVWSTKKNFCITLKCPVKRQRWSVKD